MSKFRSISLVLAFVFLGFSYPAHAGISFTIGVGDYYQPVGDYDYLAYAYHANPNFVAPTVNFQLMLSEYGNWTTLQPFGQVWQPYVAAGWRPFTQGHWIYTQEYGPYWQGYEPWAWCAYHYGNWIFSAQLGWVWIPGYDWTPGRVAWSQGYDTIGWVPLPPQGYDYSRGELSYVGPQNQFSYYDQDFGYGATTGYINYGGPYYNPQYRSMYYNPSFQDFSANLFVFIDASSFGYDNYANYYLPPDYTQYVFQQKIVRINSRPPDRVVLERIVKQPIRPVSVEVKTMQTDRQPLKVVIPADDREVDEVRKNANVVARTVIAPAFAEKQKAFKGEAAAHRDVISKVFKQENVPPKVEKVDSDQIVQQARQQVQQHEQQRVRNSEQAKQKVEKVVKEGKVRPPKAHGNQEGAGSQGTPPPEKPEKPKPEGKPQGKPADLNQGPENKTGETPSNENNPNPDKGNKVDTSNPDQDQNATVQDDKQNAQNANDKQKGKDTKKKKAKDKEKKKPNPNDQDNPPQ